ncbi:MAG: hypothetical protein IKE61_06155 [Coriobacteriales bacterium]|nr:hypothetical protein [Coriobacteriales bacterium]
MALFRKRQPASQAKQASEADVRQRSKSAIAEIRAFDEGFSANAFYREVEEKAEHIMLSRETEDINEVATCDLTPVLGKYGVIVDFNVMESTLTGFYVKDGMQHAQVVVEALIAIRRIKRPDSKKIKMILHMAKPANPSPDDEWKIAGLAMK